MATDISPDFTLTSAERQRFNQAVLAAGFDPETSWNNVITISSNGAIPSSYVQTVSVPNLAQLKAMTGVPNSLYQGNTRDYALAYPPPLPNTASLLKGTSRRELAAKLNLQEHRTLKKSADAYVFGDSAKASGNQETIDALTFPLQVNVVCAQSLTVTAGVTLNLSGYAYLIILGSLNIELAAQISSSVETVINVQVAYSANVSSVPSPLSSL